MTSNLILSICIPSYNRVLFLPDLLDSIFRQEDERVEIVICDNGSVDGTETFVREMQRLHPRIVYERFPQNVGPDRCFLRSVELASGTFCWLMGDDDIVEEGGLKRVLGALDESLTGMTVNRLAYDASLKTSRLEPSGRRRGDRLFTDPDACFSEVFVLFGFLSAQIVKRSEWLAVASEEDLTPYFNAYVLIYIIGRMIQKNPRWYYLHTPCVGWRSDNDSFAKQLGIAGRFSLDLVAYTSITQALFAKQKKVRRKIFAEVCKTHFFGHVRKMKCSSEPLTKEAAALCRRHLLTTPVFWTRLLPLLLMPKPALRMLRPVYRYWKKAH